MTHYTQNMAYFEAHKPALAKLLKNAKGERYRYEKNEHGADDIFDVRAGRFLYGVDQAGILEMAARRVAMMQPVLKMELPYMNAAGDVYGITSPLSAKLWEDLFRDGPLDRGNKAVVKDGYKAFVRVYGVGLGYELLVLTSKGGVKYLTLYEPDIELFACSLHGVPWHLLFAWFEKQGGDLGLFLGCSQQEYIAYSQRWLGKSRFLLSSFLVLQCREMDEFEAVRQEEAGQNVVLMLNAHLGWYEDQRAGFFYSTRSLSKGFPVYNGLRMGGKSRVFIIGSGPSLSENIEFIKSNREQAVIFSCGSALFLLLEHGIIPDFQFVLERFWVDFEEKIGDPSVLKQIHLVKMNAVYDVIAQYYKSTLMLLKLNEPGSAIFPERYPRVPFTNPTVTNMAIAFAARLLPDEVWLFGCDYGRYEAFASDHAAGGYYGVLESDHGVNDNKLKESASHVYPGAWGGRVFSDHWLLTARGMTERAILAAPAVRWVRVGHGALIRGVSAKRSEQLKRKPLSQIKKAHRVSDVLRAFDAGYVSQMDMAHLPDLLEAQFEDYLSAFSPFFQSSPTGKSEIIDVLSNLSHAADLARGERFPAAQLLAGSVMLFVDNAYIQTALCEDDEDACRFFARAMPRFERFLKDCRADAVRVARGALGGEMEIPFATALGTRVGVGDEGQSNLEPSPHVMGRGQGEGQSKPCRKSH